MSGEEPSAIAMEAQEAVEAAEEPQTNRLGKDKQPAEAGSSGEGAEATQEEEEPWKKRWVLVQWRDHRVFRVQAHGAHGDRALCAGVTRARLQVSG